MEEQSGPGEAETLHQKAKTRAMAAARAQATDEEVEAVLRSELGLTKRDARRRVRGWVRRGALADARTVGRLLPLESLARAAEEGDVAAATALHRRQELLEGLDPELLRQVKRWMGLEPSAVVAEVEKFLATLRAVG